MASPRWRKLSADLVAERGRVLSMIVAIAVSLLGVGARSILVREIRASYLGTTPAEATIELDDAIDPSLLAEVRARPDVADATAREVVLARVRVGDDWRPMLLFAVDDFAALRLATFRRVSGAWPPPPGTLLLERSAVGMVEAGEGATLRVKTPHGAERAITVSGLVHDPGLAPAWQERMGYGYVTVETLAALGEPAALHALLVTFRPASRSVVMAEASAQALGAWLERSGHAVHQLRVPPPAQHPHQRQMETILLMLLVFAAMALVLSAILVAATLSSMLTRQVREIGVMKAIGARTAQLAAMYAAVVAILGATAFAIAAPLGLAVARSLASTVARMLNFDLASTAVDLDVFVLQGAAAVLVPVALAAAPILRATRISVREALDHRGVRVEVLSSALLTRLPRAARNALRRPARLALTVGLLSAGGAMFMTALAVSRAWERNLEKVHETRHYDVEVRFETPAERRGLAALASVAGVRRVEAWGSAPAAFSRPGQLDVSRTYADGSHGSLYALAPPRDQRSIELPLVEGRWLPDDAPDAIVLNHGAYAQAGRPPIGAVLRLSIDGAPFEGHLAGVVEEIGSPGAAYLHPETFERVTGTEARSSMLRITSDAHGGAERDEVLRRLERALEGLSVEAVTPFSELRTAIGDHVGILIQALVAMALIMAVVGILGLVSAMGASVVERTRELGILKAVGADERTIVGLFVQEGLVIAALSWALATTISLPLTGLVDALVGQLGFLAPLPFVLAPSGIAGWAGLLAIAAVLATLVPALRAARMTVHEALREP